MTGNPREELLGLLGGYWFSQCLYVLAALDIAEHLVDGALPPERIAERCNANPDSLRRFLRAMASVGLLGGNDEDGFCPTPHLELLSADHPRSLKSLALLGGHPAHWRAWGGLLDAVRSGEPAFDATNGQSLYAAMGTDFSLRGAFDGAMTETAAADEDLVARIQVSPGDRVVDIGGGKGAFLGRLLARNPGVTGEVLEPGWRQSEKTADSLVVDPVRDAATPPKLVSGDYFEVIPADANLYLLKFVLHNLDDDRALALLHKCRNAMSPGSRLVVIESTIPPRGEEGMAIRHDVNMLVLTGGRSRSVDDLDALFARAVLRRISVTRAAGGLSIVEVARD